jgi:hypothetical protein
MNIHVSLEHSFIISYCQSSNDRTSYVFICFESLFIRYVDHVAGKENNDVGALTGEIRSRLYIRMLAECLLFLSECASVGLLSFNGECASLASSLHTGPTYQSIRH